MRSAGRSAPASIKRSLNHDDPDLTAVRDRPQRDNLNLLGLEAL